MKNKIFSILLISSLLLSLFPPASANPYSVIIRNSEDFIEFSKNCTLDSWSRGKSVRLAGDINLHGEDFNPIPTFGGSFDGCGYTISGINLSKNGSDMGVFRYIQECGSISNLKISANIVPGGSKSFIGGIAGRNSGKIESCTFDGSVQGENTIGGIAGKNENGGQIISCSVTGTISGENSTGGIAGENDGTILDCINESAVNTIYKEKKKELSSIDADTGAIIESGKAAIEENKGESVLGHTDAGGIAGLSTGVIQGCINRGAVGYPHVGYNIGGIAGRQSGYIIGCENYGFIQGRKDVGGIAGQMEPYILLNILPGNLNNIKAELEKLHSMTDGFISDADNLSSDAMLCLDNISEHAKAAGDSTEQLVKQGSELISDNLDEISVQTAVISNMLDKLIPVFDDMIASSGDMKKAFDEMISALEDIEITFPDLSNDIDNIKSALEDISKSESDIDKASEKIKQALIDLDEIIIFRRENKVKDAAADLADGVRDLIYAKNNIRSSIEKIENILNSKPDSFKKIISNIESIIENIRNIKENTDRTISSMQFIADSLDTIALNTEIDFSFLQYAFQNIDSAIEYIENASETIKSGLKNLGESIDDTLSNANKYAQDINEQLNSAKKKLSSATDSISLSTGDLVNYVGDIQKIISDFSKEKNFSFIRPDEDFKSLDDKLFDSISGISAEIDALKNIASDGKKKVISNLDNISSQFDLIISLISEEIENPDIKKEGLSDIFIDVSDEEIENAKQGKVTECKNSGKIEGDRNTGGIAGAMAIEYSKDPEDELEKPDTLNFTYRIKTILQECVNDGTVTGKKDCIGGIAGLCEIGTVYECESYGNTQSTSGSYIGGVAGKSSSAIRKSYAKCKLDGKRYVGGIAGKCSNISQCYSIAGISGEEYTGAVSGGCENREKISQNFFVDNGLGAIDGISYENSAEPISYYKLANIPHLPKRFISFSVTFIADDEIIKIQDIKYGSPASEIRYPDIPKKDGYFGTWPDIQSETVTENIELTCEYKPYITIISSKEKNKSGKLSLALAEGEFTDRAKLYIKESSTSPPDGVSKDSKVYDISIVNSDITNQDEVAVRILNPERAKVTAWRMHEDETWEQIPVSAKGKYLRLNTLGDKSTICLKYEKYIIPPVFIILSILIILILGAGIFIFKRLKKERH